VQIKKRDLRKYFFTNKLATKGEELKTRFTLGNEKSYQGGAVEKTPTGL